MTARLTDEQTVPVMRAAGVEPLEPYPGGKTPWKCRCNAARTLFGPESDEVPCVVQWCSSIFQASADPVGEYQVTRVRTHDNDRFSRSIAGFAEPTGQVDHRCGVGDRSFNCGVGECFC